MILCDSLSALQVIRNSRNKSEQGSVSIGGAMLPAIHTRRLYDRLPGNCAYLCTYPTVGWPLLAGTLRCDFLDDNPKIFDASSTQAKKNFHA
ncbi:hypothetical protein GB937_002167 [Aspergillus fischeri]|nr:hypothetical protein GB937_002167 [Aspergillus fischeri]